jgi:hypothetical protein
VFCTGDLALLIAGGSWFGAGGIVYFCPELLLMIAISKYTGKDFIRHITIKICTNMTFSS